ncbi:F0F1 ATP synthase subunit delta [Aerococcaceae bacterium DSM 111022]|nr:F0F1 ATP synthase subunit delta [Aerococcaceae bacterium DSM 111022]
MIEKQTIDHTEVIKIEGSQKIETTSFKDIHPITIRSAIDLTEEQIQRIVDAVRKITNEQFTHIYHVIDHEILMGVSVNTDSFYYELSGIKMLEELEILLKDN